MTIPPAPPAIEAIVDVATLEVLDDPHACSGALLLRGPEVFVKVAPSSSPYPVRDEIARARWAHGYGLAPEVLGHGEREGFEWMASALVHGRGADRCDREVAIDVLVEAVVAVHAMPAAACPFTFDGRAVELLARGHIREGAIDPDYVMAVTGTSVEAAAAALLATRIDHHPPDPVVLHGDTSAKNLVVRPDGTWAWVDWGWAGVGDRHHDLATTAITVAQRLDIQAAATFLDRYSQRSGVEIDESKLAAYRLLDAFS